MILHRIKTISLPAYAGYDTRARVFWILISALVCLVFIHIFAVGSTTRNIALRQELEKEAISLGAEIGTLEFTHIGLKNTIDLDLALSQGYKEAKNPTYVSRIGFSGLGKLTLNR